MKSLLAALLVPTGLFSQSITITAPTAGQSIAGTSFVFQSTLSGLPSTCSVEYDVNGEIAGYVYAAPWSIGWNTFYVSNNPYNSLIAVAKDCLNNTIATSSTVAFTVSNLLPEPTSQLTFTVTPPSGTTWTGTVTFALSLSGTNATRGCVSAPNHCIVHFYIDGFEVGVGSGLPKQMFGTGNFTYNLDTTKFDNGLHDIYWRLDDTSQPLGNNVSWWNAGEWHRQIAFANSAVAMELRLSTAEAWLCTTSLTNCPTSEAITGKIFKTDESSSTATFSSAAITASYPGSGVVTLSSCSSCSSVTITKVSVGSAQITFTSSGGFTRTLWVHVNTANEVPHFNTSGGINKTYSSTSLFYASAFFSQATLNDPDYPSAYVFQQDYGSAGYNAIEYGCWTVPQSWQSQSAWQSSMSSYVTTAVGLTQPYGLYLHLICDGAMRGTPDVYNTTRTASASWSPTAVTTMFTDWLSQNVIGNDMVDEVNLIWGGCPLCGQLLLSNSIFSSNLVCTNGGNCVINLGTFGGVQLEGGDVIASGLSTFVIVGATTNSCLNSPSSTGTVYRLQNRGSHAITFTNPCGSSLTATSSTDPRLVIEPFGMLWTTAALHGNPCSSGCTDYVHHDAFSNFMTWANAVTGRMKITWPNAQGYSPSSFTNWEGPSMSDYSTMYYNVDSDYLPQYMNQMNLLSAIGTTFRQRYGFLGSNRLAPILSEGAATAVAYGQEGYAIGVTSCSNNLVTFSAPHGIGTVLPWNTRLQITRSNGAACDGNYYIIDTPTATTAHIAMVSASFTASFVPANDGAAVHFTDGTTAPVFELSSGTTKSPGGHFLVNQDNSSCTVYNLPSHRGQYVTFTQGVSSVGSFTSTTWWIVPAPMNGNCAAWRSQNQLSGQIAQVPSLRSTGGMATIYLNANYTRGINYVGPQSSEVGPRFMAAESFYCIILAPCAGSRVYAMTTYLDDPSSQYARTAGFGDNTSGGISAGMHPRYLNYGNSTSWIATSIPNKLAQRLAKLTFCQTGSAPDYGMFVEATVRQSCAAGNVQLIQSFADYPISRTIDLSGSWASGCNTSLGQSFTLYSASWQGIVSTTLAAGSTSTSFTFNPDSAQFLAVMCAANSEAEYSPPVINTSLADIPNASKIVVRYSYSPFPLNASQVAQSVLTRTQDCGTGTCTLPVDRQIGTVYYQLVFLSSSNTVLATSDVQTL